MLFRIVTAAPSPELVERVRDLYHKRVPDVRFLIPVLIGLNKVNLNMECSVLKTKTNFLCFGQPDPTYRNQPTLDFFFTKMLFFSFGSL